MYCWTDDRQTDRHAEIRKDRQINGHKIIDLYAERLIPFSRRARGESWPWFPVRNVRKMSEIFKDLQMFYITESPEHVNRKIVQVTSGQVPACEREFLKPQKRAFLKSKSNKAHLLVLRNNIASSIKPHRRMEEGYYSKISYGEFSFHLIFLLNFRDFR